MKAYEVPVQVTLEGKLDIPSALLEVLPRGQVVRMIVLVSEPTDTDEQRAWSRLTAEQFFAGYSEVDAVYNKMG